MCQSKANGGRRCAAHTRPGFHAALLTIQEADDSERPMLLHAGRHAFLAHALTRQGHAEVAAATSLFEETYRVFPATSAAQEAQRAELLAGLALIREQAATKAQIDDEVRRRNRQRAITSALDPATDPSPMPDAARIRADLAGVDVDVTDGEEVAWHLADTAGLTRETLNDIVAADLVDRGEWPEDQSISGSDIASHLEWLGTEDVEFLYGAIARAAERG